MVIILCLFISSVTQQREIFILDASRFFFFFVHYFLSRPSMTFEIKIAVLRVFINSLHDEAHSFPHGPRLKQIAHLASFK